MRTTREMEIAQGLREPGGALIGGLQVEDYLQGRADYESGAEPPKVTSTSYDLGWRRAADEAEALADLKADLKRRSEASHAMMQELLKDRPDLLAEYNARIAAIEAA
jgi:hypothetical protein